MKTLALASLPIACLAIGCSSAQPIPHAAEAPIGLRAAHVDPIAFDSINDEENPYVSQPSDPRSVGDWVTTELTNGGRPVTVQQRVLSRDGAMSVVEVAIKDGPRTHTFRLRSEATRAGDQVLDVTRVESGVEHASTLAAYEAVMQKTVPNVERNDGMMDTEPVAIDVGARKIAAVRTTYKVVVNGKPATMSVIHSDTFAWGDLGGDIVTEAGKTLYSTRIVDTGSAPRAVASEK
jgi:hypothetical protein